MVEREVEGKDENLARPEGPVQEILWENDGIVKPENKNVSGQRSRKGENQSK